MAENGERSSPLFPPPGSEASVGGGGLGAAEDGGAGSQQRCWPTVPYPSGCVAAVLSPQRSALRPRWGDQRARLRERSSVISGEPTANSSQSTARTLPEDHKTSGRPPTENPEPKTQNWQAEPCTGGTRRRRGSADTEQGSPWPKLSGMEKLPLVIGIAAAVLVVFWLVKKLMKLAIWAALLGVAAWIWYFKIR